MSRIKYLIVDVDGTMTDAGIYYDEKGNELKKFSTRDAAGFFAAQKVGIEIVVLTGRECKATRRRMNEMGVKHLYQNIKDKAKFLKEFICENQIGRENIGYIGDDLNDLPSMILSGFVGCPADSCKEVMEIADYISTMKGGQGVVRDVVEHLLHESGEWERVVSELYGTGS